MKKWLDEEYEFRVEVVGFLQGDSTEHYCRNGEEVGDTYHCTYGSPVNGQGYGICPKAMLTLFPLMEAVRSGVKNTVILDGRIPHSILIELLSDEGIGTMLCLGGPTA